MLVKYVLHKPSWNPTGFYVAEAPSFCCDKMKSAWDERSIGFGHPEFYSKRTVESLAVCLRSWTCYPEGASCTIFEICFCPFCRAKITTQEVPDQSVLT